MTVIVYTQPNCMPCNADIAKAVGMDRNSVAKIIRQGKGKA